MDFDMRSCMTWLVGFVGLCIGALGMHLWWRFQHQSLLQKRLVEQEDSFKQEISNLSSQSIRLQTELEKEREHFAEKTKMALELEQKFENLSHKIFSTHLSTFQSNTKDTLGHILNPLRERIETFSQKVDDQFEKKVRDITTLKTEIQNIRLSNEEITKAAHNLTMALKGDVKTQGNWGEFVLTKILEASGLREGHEYSVQGKDLKLTNQDGQHLKPDVIVHLPDQKHIIVDSKVSLTHYEGIVSSADEEQARAQLQGFLLSVKNHIDGLSKKKYHHLDQLITPEFVLMFMPIEGAFSMALQNDDKLYSYAWDKQIVMVSPTTLLATLRTVESLWKMDRQNQNAMEIARQAGALYDKFVGFVTDLADIDRNLDRTRESYDSALNKLKEGRGNLITRVENLKTMGAKTSKSIPNTFQDDEKFLEEVDSKK